MAGKKFKQRKTDVIQDGVVYRLCEDRFEEEYSVYTYTEDLPEKVRFRSAIQQEMRSQIAKINRYVDKFCKKNYPENTPEGRNSPLTCV